MLNRGRLGQTAVRDATRINASILCVLHEIWEAYIKSGYGKMLYRLRDKVSLPNRAAFHSKNRKWRFNTLCDAINRAAR